MFTCFFYPPSPHPFSGAFCFSLIWSDAAVSPDVEKLEFNFVRCWGVEFTFNFPWSLELLLQYNGIDRNTPVRIVHIKSIYCASMVCFFMSKDYRKTELKYHFTNCNKLNKHRMRCNVDIAVLLSTCSHPRRLGILWCLVTCKYRSCTIRSEYRSSTLRDRLSRTLFPLKKTLSSEWFKDSREICMTSRLAWGYSLWPCLFCLLSNKKQE